MKFIGIKINNEKDIYGRLNKLSIISCNRASKLVRILSFGIKKCKLTSVRTTKYKSRDTT